MFQNALALHVRFLWGLLDPRDVPSNPLDKELRIFDARFSVHKNLYDIPTGPPLVPLSLVKVGLSVSLASGRIAAQAQMIEEHILEYMQACIARFGLTRWAPDLRQTPYSLYNAACRIIALDTFKQAVVAHTYDHIGPNVAYVKDVPLLIKLYDHFVHYYLFNRYKKDSCNAGSVRVADEANPIYKNRARVRDICCAFFLI